VIVITNDRDKEETIWFNSNFQFSIFFKFQRHLGLSGTSPSLTLPPPPPPFQPKPPSTLSDQAPNAGLVTLTAGLSDLQQQMDQQQQQSHSNQMVTQGSARAICAALPGLVSRQIQVCQAHPNTIQSVSDGARKVKTTAPPPKSDNYITTN
jgi:hypothetical protein